MNDAIATLVSVPVAVAVLATSERGGKYVDGCPKCSKPCSSVALG